MMKLLGSALLVGGLVTLARPAWGQRRTAVGAPAGARYEFGVDFAGYYDKPSGGTGGIQMGVPVDVRVAFLTRSALMWEPRLSFDLNSVGGTTIYTFDPGINVLYQLSRGSGPYNLVGAPYLTGGVAINFFKAGPTSGSQFSLGGGIGKRVPYGSSVGRMEGFLSYTLKGSGMPSSFAIGARLGMSFWH
jgi:hypothetical protein